MSHAPGDSPRSFPPGWSKTIADLLAEGRHIEGEEIAWARAYERAQLPPGTRFPREGEVYELMRDADVSYLTHWSVPFTGGGKGRLPQGTRVRILGPVSEAEPIGVAASPLDEARIESLLVPLSDRQAPTYGSFSLSLSTRQLNEDFRWVADAPVR